MARPARGQMGGKRVTAAAKHHRSRRGGHLLALAEWLLCAYAFSLAFMQPSLAVGSYAVVASDLVFVSLAGLFGTLLVTRQARLAGDRAFLFIGLYFAAMAASLLVSADRELGVTKLATQLYLLALPVLLCSLVRDERMLRKVVLAWLAGTVVVALVGISSLAMFAVDATHPLLERTRFQFGSLPPGPYPRLQLTFLNANMACNYLVVSFALLLAASRIGWVSRGAAWLLGAGILISAAATISPGLGGFALLIGGWSWLLQKQQRPDRARMALGAGAALALLFVAAMTVTPVLHPTAPFIFHLPVVDITLAPSPRLMVWIEAWANFLDRPLFGQGIGSDAVAVRYREPSGHLQLLTDAHNMFLNIAVQCGLLGLAALLALLAHMIRRTGPLRLGGSAAATVRLAAGLGLVNGLAYQGLGGSFEDARHLWFAFGLLLASSRIEGDQTRMGMRT